MNNEINPTVCTDFRLHKAKRIILYPAFKLYGILVSLAFRFDIIINVALLNISFSTFAAITQLQCRVRFVLFSEIYFDYFGNNYFNTEVYVLDT